MKTFTSSLSQTILKWNLHLFTLAAIALAICVPAAVAQSGAGSIQGTVTDSTGAVIPNALIHVVNTATNVTTDTKSNAVGFYQVPELFTGTYSVTVTAPGMKTYKTSIELLVAQNATINASMSTGEVTQQVEVAADTVQLTTTDNGTIAATLENTRISQLPMNGRVLTTLAGEATPGLESGGTRANGLMGEALEYVADGVSLANRQFGGMNQAQAQSPDPDSVQEVEIETTNTSAQYSEPATAIVTTKSGTNSLHGALFETARNNAIGVAKVRQNPANFAAPHLVRNEFGGSVGGPIIFPHIYHGKDKSFFFVAWEKYSLASSQSENVSVPTLAMRKGDWSGLTNSNGVSQQLYDPATTQASANCNGTGVANQYCRTPFGNGVLGDPGNNQIPIGRLSPTSKIIYDITAVPNLPDNPTVEPNLQGNNPNNSFMPNMVFRLDHVFNENNRAYLRYGSNVQTTETLRNYPFNSPYTIAADGLPNQASGIAYNPSSTFTAGIGYTHVFSPTFFAETIVSQQWFGQHNFAGGTPFADFETTLGLPNNFKQGGFPNFGANLICPYGGTQFIYGLSQIIQDADENMSKTFGKHQFQFGGRYRHERFGDLPDESADTIGFGQGSSPSTGVGEATGLYNTATGVAAAAPLANTGYPDGDMFLGAASNFSVVHQPPYAHYHDYEFDAYFQDNYRVTRNLTLNLGLRWEDHPAPWTKYGAVVGFDLKNDATVFAVAPATLIAEGLTTQAIITNITNDGGKIETAAEAGQPANTLMRNYSLTFSPRVGLAYQLFGGKTGTVVRGAYGRYIYPIPTRSTLKNIQQNTPFTGNYSTNYDQAAQSPDGQNNYMVRGAPPSITGANTANVVNSSTNTSILPGKFTEFNLAPNMPPDYVTQVNFTIEQQLKGNTALRISWLWSHGTNLDEEFDYNNAYSQYAWEMKTGLAKPSGTTVGLPTYAATALNPYDATTWGGNTQQQKTGWSNDNALQVNYQRLFHHGIAYQISYVWSKPFRVGGNYFRDGYIDSPLDYVNSGIGTMSLINGDSKVLTPHLPPAAPSGLAPYADWHAFNKYMNYLVDTAIPKQHINFNGIVDLPFGRGKKFLGNSNKFVDELVGGFQIAGDGQVVSQDFALLQPTSSTSPVVHWGSTNPTHVYGHQYKLTDCRSGTCRKAYEWFNGYIAPSAINAATKGVSGLPSGYVAGSPTSSAFLSPINNDPAQSNYGNDNVNVTLSNNSVVATGFSPGPIGANPFSHTVLNGPFNYNVDLSVFKVFPITEKVNLRFNVDAFNALNIQGYINPSVSNGSSPGTLDGTEQLNSSYWTGRQLQLTLRLQF